MRLRRRGTFALSLIITSLLGLYLTSRNVNLALNDVPFSRGGPMQLPKTKHFLGVLTIVKNDGDVIKEWLSFTLRQGASIVYVVDDWSDDGTASELEPYVERGQVVYLRYPKERPREGFQTKALNWAFQHERIMDSVTWLALIDVDEYLWAPFDLTLPGVLLTAPSDVSQILVPWHTFNSDGKIAQPESVIQGFTTRANWCKPTCESTRRVHVKSIARARDVRRLRVHAHDMAGGNKETRTVYHDFITEADEDEFLIDVNKEELGVPQLRINHYQLMSKSRFMGVKSTRGDILLQHNVRDEKYFESYDSMNSGANDDDLKRRYAACGAPDFGDVEDHHVGGAVLAVLSNATSVKWGDLLKSNAFLALLRVERLRGSWHLDDRVVSAIESCVDRMKNFRAYNLCRADDFGWVVRSHGTPFDDAKLSSLLRWRSQSFPIESCATKVSNAAEQRQSRIHWPKARQEGRRTVNFPWSITIDFRGKPPYADDDFFTELLTAITLADNLGATFLFPNFYREKIDVEKISGELAEAGYDIGGLGPGNDFPSDCVLDETFNNESYNFSGFETLLPATLAAEMQQAANAKGCKRVLVRLANFGFEPLLDDASFSAIVADLRQFFKLNNIID